MRIGRFPAKRDKIYASFKNGVPPKVDGWNAQKERMKKKEERKAKVVVAYSCKKAVYENCKMVAPDGELLSNCDFKKA